MKDFLSLTKNRKTTYQFSNKAISDSKIKRVIEAAQWSPSCSNSQPWHFIIIKDRKRIEALIRGTHSVNYPFIQSNPSLVIAFILQPNCLKGDHTCAAENLEGQINESRMCLGMSALNATLEAEDLGVSSCILTPRQSHISKILKLRKEDLPLMILGFGYEDKKAYKRKRNRKEINDIISYEIFGNLNKNFKEKIPNVTNLKKSSSISESILIEMKNDRYKESRISLMKRFIKPNKNAIYVSFNNSALDLKKEFGKIVNTNNLFFVDGIGKGKSNDKRIQFLQGPSSLTELSIVISNLISKNNIDYVIFDSLPLFFINNSPNLVEKFIHYINSKLNEKKVSSLIITLDDEKSKRFTETISQFCNSKIKL